MIKVPKAMSKTIPTQAQPISRVEAGKPQKLQLNNSPFNERGGSPAGADGVCSIAPSAQTNKVKPPPQSLLSRLKKIKNIELYAAVAVIAVMVLIFFSSFGSPSAPKNNTNALTKMENEFVREMEQKLTSTLSQIRGAGRVNAMVTAVGSATLEIAYNIDEKTITQGSPGGASNTTTTVVKTPVIVNTKDGPQPLILFEIKPKLLGVVIVAPGAHDPAVRFALLRAVQALVSDPSVNIEILAGK